MMIAEGGNFKIKKYQKIDDCGRTLTCYHVTDGEDGIMMTPTDFKILLCVMKIAAIKEGME